MFDSLKQFYWGLKEATPILRCIFGVTFALVLATTLGYMIPHITAIFTLMFLEPNKKPLGLKKELGIVLGLLALGYFGVLVGDYLIDFPLVLIPILGLIVYWSFRYVKLPEAVRMLFLMLAILIPFVSLKANMLGSIVLMALLMNLVIALVVIRLAFFIFPLTDPEKLIISQDKPISKSTFNLDKMALNGLLVLLPMVFIFYLYSALSAVLILVFAVILSFDPFIYQSKKGTALIMANAIGGLAAIVAYNMLVVAPSYVLYIFIIVSAAFYFISMLYSGKKTAPIFKISFNTFFVIMGVISTSTNEAGNEIWLRILQIGIAVIYVILAFKVVNAFNNPIVLNEQ